MNKGIGNGKSARVQENDVTDDGGQPVERGTISVAPGSEQSARSFMIGNLGRFVLPLLL
jgi:hypothetical protein